MDQWSKEIQIQTQEILTNLQPHIFALNKQIGRKGVILKNLDDRYGYITEESCLQHHYEVRDNSTDEILESYSTIAELLKSGWVVD